MKVFAFFLAWVNIVMVPAIGVAASPSIDGLSAWLAGWLFLTTWTLMIVVGVLTALDMIRPGPRRLFLGGMSLTILATACLSWAIHLTLIGGDGGGMLVIGGSALVQSVASLWELMPTTTA
jgi:hypothetical protein